MDRDDYKDNQSILIKYSSRAPKQFSLPNYCTPVLQMKIILIHFMERGLYKQPFNKRGCVS